MFIFSRDDIGQTLVSIILPTNLRRPSLRKCGQSFRTFFVETSISSGICSIPMTRPRGPTIKAIQADKYPEPEPTSNALAPSKS